MHNQMLLMNQEIIELFSKIDGYDLEQVARPTIRQYYSNKIDEWDNIYEHSPYIDRAISEAQRRMGSAISEFVHTINPKGIRLLREALTNGKVVLPLSLGGASLYMLNNKENGL